MRKSVLLILLLVTAGCTAPADRAAPPASEPPAAEKPGATQAHPKAKRPVDRDARAVDSALRKIDACRLISSYVQRHPEAGVIPRGPHSCLLSPKKDYTPGLDGLTVSVGDASDHLSRYGGKPITVGGAKAYLTDRSTPGSSACDVTVPVSFTRGVTLSYHVSGKKDTCDVVGSLTKDVVKALRDPDKVAVDSAKRPFSAWDGCTFLAALLGTEAARYDYHPQGAPDPFSGCAALGKPGPNKKTGQTPVLEVEYKQWSNPAIGEIRRVGDKEMNVSPASRGCVVSWNQGASLAGNKWFADQVFTLTAADCDSATRLAGAAVTLANRPPADAKPQRPLVYGPKEPDIAPVGACRDFAPTNGEDCQPYQKVPAPRGTEQLMAAAAADKNVQCTVFFDLVHALFGDQFAPLTWGDHCVFVEPTHALIITADVDPKNPPADYGKGNSYLERRTVTLGGHQAVTFYDTHKTSYDIYLTPGNDLNGRGNLHLKIEAKPPRGNGHTTEIPLKQAKAARADEIMADAAQKYLK